MRGCAQSSSNALVTFYNMFIDIGPVSVLIRGEKDGKEYKFHREHLAKEVDGILTELREALPVLKQRASMIKNVSQLPEIARRMVDAAKKIDEVSLTPMAAVAGAVSDEIKKYLIKEGLHFISVNNGGDISVYNKTGRMVRVGIGSMNKDTSTPYSLRIEGLSDFGIATSGFGGRSFTLGLADVATVVAENGAVADAAATFVCNMTNCETDRVLRRKASDIDPLTDIPEELVTVSIGELDDNQVSLALANGLSAAERLRIEGLIYDAFILFRGHFVTTIDGERNIKLEVQEWK